MNGGPGASSLMGLFTELGPLLLNERSVPAANNGSTWRLQSNPHSWSHVAGLLVWEQPAGVGFSRCVDGCPARWNDATSAEANVAFLRAFYATYPDAASRDLVISGESYGGVYVPLLAQKVLGDAALAASGVRLTGAAVGDGSIGYAVSGGGGSLYALYGGSGRDSLDISCKLQLERWPWRCCCCHIRTAAEYLILDTATIR